MSNENSDALYWITSAGGPLLLLEEGALPYWNGNFGQNPTDYDKTFVFNDYLGVIEVDSQYGLVLGGEPTPTSWWPFAEGRGGLLVRWLYADGDDAVINAVRLFPEERWRETDISIDLSRGPLILFDSVCPGSDVDCLGTGCKIRLDLKPGRYGIGTAIYQPDADTSLVLHRLEWKE